MSVGERGRAPSRPSRSSAARSATRVTQTPLTGHASHRRTRAVHTSAPSSMSAWLCTHAAFPVRGRIASAIAQSVFWPRPLFGSIVGANARCSTRATLVSTSAARCSNANEATAPAV